MAKDRSSSILALVAAILCIALGYLSRLALNPDGVSYLDLAAAVPRHDWSHFVQGYWSPLFPFLAGLISRITGLTGSGLVPVTHAINAIAATAAVWVLWRWGRAVAPTRPLFGRIAIAAFLLCSWGLPKIEAVTPDVIALLVAVALCHELLARGGERWLLTGALLGLSFLVRTSSWPVLLLLIPLRLWSANDAAARRRVWWSTAACAALMLVWIVPMSIKSGQPTLGSSGRLNYSWYIDANTSRLPDGDRGVNSAYRDVSLGNGETITVATFDDAEHWTYQPWGDPTAWADKVMSDVGSAPTAGQLIGYWMRMIGWSFGWWLMPMILATMLPVYLLSRRPGMRRELVTTQRNATLLIVAGFAGVMQFVVIHVEPRLIAPYAIMAALGVIWWCTALSTESANRMRPSVRRVLGWIGVAVALAATVPTFVESVESTARLTTATQQLDAIRQRLSRLMRGPVPIAIIGPAAPALSAAYWSGVRIRMQIPPHSAKLLGALPPDQQTAILGPLFRGMVPLVWKTTADGGIEMLIVPDDSTHKSQP
jgi:hypothetical protein